jgi:pimeloyl-ACP methyl ester carboxylesterase
MGWGRRSISGSDRGVVLVHGLWHDPGHFGRVAAHLRREGVRVAVPELHRGSLTADTAAVQMVVDAMGRPPVVLGHSYGGSVITGLTGIAHLVYLAAFVPTDSESAAQLGGGSHLVDPLVRPRPDGRTELDPVGAAAALYDGCSTEDAARAVALLRPQAPGHGRGVPQRTAWREVPSTYVICAADRAVDPALQRRLASRCGTVITWLTGHCPFWSRPRLVAGLLLTLITDVR